MTLLDLRGLDKNLISQLTKYLTPKEKLSKQNNGEFLCTFDCFFQDPSENHYHLLANISDRLNNKKFIDLGTYRGYSALALSYNKINSVLTFDLEKDYRERDHSVFQDQEIKKKR